MGLLQRIGGLFDHKPPARPAQRQREVDSACAALVLYHFPSCPYCARVRRRIERLALAIEERDVRADPAAREELLAGGGHEQVPCLRIDGPAGDRRWLYESADIIRYLEGQFAD